MIVQFKPWTKKESFPSFRGDGRWIFVPFHFTMFAKLTLSYTNCLLLKERCSDAVLWRLTWKLALPWFSQRLLKWILLIAEIKLCGKHMFMIQVLFGKIIFTDEHHLLIFKV